MVDLADTILTEQETPARQGALSGAVDGYKSPARFLGWVGERAGGRFISGVHVEARRDGQLIAQSSPSAPRLDVTQNEPVPVAFEIDLNGIGTPQEVLHGTIRFFAVNEKARCLEIPLYKVTRHRIERDIFDFKEPDRNLLAMADAAAIDALRAEVGRLGIKRALIVTSMLNGLHGSPLVALDAGRVLASAGVMVDFLTLNLAPSYAELFARRGIRCFDPVHNPFPIEGAAYDLVWGQHWPAYGFVFLELCIRARYFALVSLSSFEPLESVDILLQEADIVVFNAQSTQDETLAGLPTGISKPMAITGNALPSSWFSPAARPIPVDQPRAVAFISNRRVEELRQASDLLAAQGVHVAFFGVLDKTQLVEQDLIDRFDVIVTIGHSIQKALARGRPAYCYDCFGGAGYIGLANLDMAAKHNFSGRESPSVKSASQIASEILTLYPAAAAQAEKLAVIAAQRFRLELVMAGLLEQIGLRRNHREFRNDKCSPSSKLVRYGVNTTVNYPLFTPANAITRDGKTAFVRLVRTSEPNANIAFFCEVNAASPSLYSVSRQARTVSVYGFLLAVPEAEITGITVEHDNGLVTRAVQNQPSPWLAQKFPTNPQAAHGRFEVQLTLHMDVRQAKFVAILQHGARVVFYTVRFEPITAP